jgi:hypothetical protein
MTSHVTSPAPAGSNSNRKGNQMMKLQAMTLLALTAGVIGAGSTAAHAKVCPDGSVVPFYESCPRDMKVPRPLPHQAGTATFASGGIARSGTPKPYGPPKCWRPDCSMGYKPPIRPKQ